MPLNPDLAKLVGGVDFDPDALREKYRAERDKRLRDDGNAQYLSTNAEFSDYVEDPYVEPGFVRDPLTDESEVVIIGAGFGGLMMGGRLRAAGFDDVRFIDKAGDFGGTWYWNRYPGAACDVESYVYLPFLEETAYVPHHKYSFAPEIFEYCKLLARHFDLYRNTCFQTSVTGLRWDEGSSRWIITTDRGDRMRAKFVVISTGLLDRPKLPAIPGIETFKGHTFHTSRWDYGYTGGGPEGKLENLSDKRVGIVGTGATAIQVVPHLARSAKHLTVFQRTPSSVDARGNRPTDPAQFENLSPGWQERRMENFTNIIHGGEESEDLVDDGWTDMFKDITGEAAKRRAASLGRPITRSERQELTELADFKKMERIRKRTAEIVEDPETAEGLMPWYRQFCKRPCFHDEYLPAFNRPNVTLVDTGGRGIEALTQTGVVFDGVEYPLDCLIFATGFEVGVAYTKRLGYDVIGRDGLRLSEKWGERIRSFYGLQTHNFPNLFFLGFTQTAFTFLVPFTLNEQAKHVAYLLERTRAQGAETVEATKAAEDGWCAEMQSKEHLGREFYAECTPGYYNNEGDVKGGFGVYTNMYGGGPMRFLEILRDYRASGGMEGQLVG